MKALVASLVLLAALHATCAHADAAASAAARVHSELVKHVPGLKPEQVRPSQVPGLFEVTFGNGTAYVTADGKYLVKGELYDVATRTNLTEAGRVDQRRAVLATIKDADAIVFAPPQPKHTITVFTDVECGYCRKLHSEIAQYNDRGIAVRYVAYPRAGPGSDDWKTMEAVWCSSDRRDALTRAKRGEKIERPENCGKTPVAEQYALGEQLGVPGTPMIVLDDGRKLDGYVSAGQLTAMFATAGANDNKAARATP
ncbi:MAG TPA: DsbC family protein [Steroidobacteraceae bacterium]|nr:DsbC family protein [Steroidobacteraceae bacterium]